MPAAKHYNSYLAVMQKTSLQQTLRVLLVIVLLFVILFYSKPFLAPVMFALVISMLLLPVVSWLQKKRFPNWLAVLMAVLLFVVVIGGIIAILAWQVSGLTKDLGNVEQQAMQKVTQFQQYIQQKLGVSVKEQNKIASGSAGSSSGSYLTSAVSGLLAGIGSFLTDFILFIVYTFLFMFYRSHLKEFLLRMFFSHHRNQASTVMERCRQVAQKYVSGLALMIICLSVMYSIGFGIVGVKSAFLFAMLAAVLETVPFIGNITGTLLTMLMTVAQGGSNLMVLGVFITYVTVQFIQTYFLETLVVGESVNLNPLVTIAGLIVGELVWGIAGMVLTIPLLGMTKIIFDNVELLKPMGFLLGKVKSK